MLDFGKFEKKGQKMSTHDERRALDKADSLLSGAGGGGYSSYAKPRAKEDDDLDNMLEGIIGDKVSKRVDLVCVSDEADDG